MNPLSLSRSDDKTLLDYEKQEEYYYTNIKSKRGEAKLYAIRKLREGLLASKRIDEFSILVYEDSVDECILQENFQELSRSIARLLDIYCVSGVSARKTEMQNYFILYQYCYNNQPNVSIITKQMEKYNIDPDGCAIRFIRSINICDYLSAESQWRKMSRNDKTIACLCFSRFRPQVLEALKKSFFTLPATELQKALLMDPFNEKDEHALNRLLPFGIDSNGICCLKRRK
jgi:hypothetical protein